ncbi:MAG TPA: hypothetical protein VFZ09_47790 [Archangium sp.]|uniref:WD40/YVTN/BNR-like repeat-containing protein n=1 Tax=Archangium sp. TaxID=1872627 RepID=UPI002E374CA2|nr:hypothetical protein [Archangium sp.]HEX5753980.1 hypothetical protein [Archangium sp.]
MSQKKKWMFLSVTTVAGLAACAPQVVTAYNNWKQERRNALIAKTEQALAQGLDYIPWMDSLRSEDEDEEHEGLVANEEENEEAEKDDAALRRLALQAEIGPRSPEYQQELLKIAAAEARKWNGTGATSPMRLDGDASALSPTPAGDVSWVNLGPATARSSYNGTYYKSIDSGRLTKIRVKPGDAKTVYIATAGGGVWKATDFGQYPTWKPITDQLGTLAVGAMELDPTDGKTVWLGLGDAFDQQGGGLVKSTDEGKTWGDPILLSATHPVDGQPTVTSNVRDIRIDPADANNLLVATNDGFYRSTDGGATFGFIDLPNTAATGPVREATWDLVYLGQGTDGQSQWLVSGAYACPGGQPPHPASGTQNRLLSVAACASNPAVGNYGDIWKSTDSGATWVSARAGGTLPATVTGSTATDISHINLAGSGTADPTATVVYAIGGSLSDAASATNAVLKSVDGGNTWTVVATKATPVTNPTPSQCTDVNAGHDQSWYNLAIAVDPADPNRVLIGGNLCGIRSSDGGATWQNMAHWLPQGGGGYTAEGFLPYVHADWHTATVVRVGAIYMALVGTDGGLSVSRDVFDAPTGAQVTWQHPNIGLVTHLPYSVGSGDPVYGNANVVFAGLQDNGTRFRLIEDEAFIFDYDLQNWDQILGGDGIGTAVSRDSRGQNPVYWTSVQGRWQYCQPRLRDCSRATRIENGVELANQARANFTLPTGDSYPFMIRYSPTFDAQGSVVANSSLNIWRLTVDPVSDRPSAVRLTPSGISVAGATRGTRGLGVTASPHTYTVDGVPARIYGLPLSSGASALLVDKGSSVSLRGGATILQVPNGSGGFDQLGFIQSVAIPRQPESLGGTDSTKTWLVSSVGSANLAGGAIPDSVGHLFKTTDQGATWVPFHGNGTGFDLPNVPVWVVRFDPATDSIIYAGTELGLYRSTDGGATWARYGKNLPMVRTYDLTIASNGSLLRVATYGRGIWEVHPKSEANATPGNGDWDGNGVVDYFDLAAMAGRLGTTPATPTHLRYDNTLDLTSSPTTIEEADLSALLGKFGSTP